MGLTRDDIARVHGILVLKEAKSIHELDFRNFTSTMASEMICDILLCGYDIFQSVLCHPEKYTLVAPVMVVRMSNQAICASGRGRKSILRLRVLSPAQGYDAYRIVEDCPSKDESPTRHPCWLLLGAIMRTTKQGLGNVGR